MARNDLTLNIIKSSLINNKIDTLANLKKLSNTNSTMTVFRKLKRLDYLSSYSHRGKYYTLKSIAEFDDIGLWSCNDIWFSKYGNLMETTREFVEQSKAGFSANELFKILNVEAKQPLLGLFKQDKLHRQKISSRFVYFSPEPAKRKEQVTTRKSRNFYDFDVLYETEVFHDDLLAAIILFYSILDERQRRLYAGLESFKLGHGGDKKIADILGISSHTVARGRNEILSKEIDKGEVRKKGGGRKSLEKKIQKS